MSTLRNNRDRVLWSVGLHPHDAERWPDEHDEIVALAADAHAIGECGLDFYRNLAPREAQMVAFDEQLALAGSLGKPIIIHCRDAAEPMLAELRARAERGACPRGVMHCWSGTPDEMAAFARAGVDAIMTDLPDVLLEVLAET